MSDITMATATTGTQAGPQTGAQPVADAGAQGAPGGGGGGGSNQPGDQPGGQGTGDGAAPGGPAPGVADDPLIAVCRRALYNAELLSLGIDSHAMRIEARHHTYTSQLEAIGAFAGYYTASARRLNDAEGAIRRSWRNFDLEVRLGVADVRRDLEAIDSVADLQHAELVDLLHRILWAYGARVNVPQPFQQR
ncbi:unnamed protein product [Peniophora sp. CBMAI 1063]|nr:unnamed protein product [Peniophora sp. CBMAI 1063]